MSVVNLRRYSLKSGLQKGSDFADIPYVPPSPTIVTAGLVRYYNAGNTSSYPGTGTTWTDLQASGYNLTLQNSPTFVSSGAGSYFTFDGSNDYAEGNDTGLPDSTNPRTVLFWSYRISPTDFKSMWGYGTANSNQGWFAYQTAGYSPNNRAWLLDKYGGGAGGAGEFLYAQNVWTYTGITWASNNYEYFLNGVSVGTGTFSGVNTVLAGATGLFLGKSVFGTGYYDGRIAQYMVYNTALSSADVLQNFNATKANYGL